MFWCFVGHVAGLTRSHHLIQLLNICLEDIEISSDSSFVKPLLNLVYKDFNNITRFLYKLLR